MSLNKAQFDKSMALVWQINSNAYNIIIQAINGLGLKFCQNFEFEDPRVQMRLLWLRETLERCQKKGLDINEPSDIGFSVFAAWTLSGRCPVKQKIAILQCLYDYGANPLIPTKGGLRLLDLVRQSVYEKKELVDFIEELSQKAEIEQLKSKLQENIPKSSSSGLPVKKHL